METLQQSTRAASRAAQVLRKAPYLVPSLNAFITPPEQKQHLGDDAEAQSSQFGSEYESVSPIVGKSFQHVSFKDNIVTSWQPTTCGSQILKEYQSPFIAEVAYRLTHPTKGIPSTLFSTEQAGKTNMDEFGMGSHAQTSAFGPVKQRPPHSHVSAGGSSGGSAVAVATEQVSVAVGTDTGGSVRLPAAYTSVIGFKPSYGRYSRWGVVPYANSLDTVGLLSKRLPALFKADEILSYKDPRDPSSMNGPFRKRQWPILKAQQSLDHGPKRSKFIIGIPVEYNVKELDPGIKAAWMDLLYRCQKAGHRMVPISLPHTKQALSAYYVLAAAEAASNLSKFDGVRYGTRSSFTDGAGHTLYSKTRGDGFGSEVRQRILLGSYTLSSEGYNNHFIKAQKVRRLVQRDFDRVFAMPNPLRNREQHHLSTMDDNIDLDDKNGPSQVDMILCPAAPTPPPSIGDLQGQSPVDTYLNDVFTVPASLAGLPVMTIPVRIDAQYRKEGDPHGTGMQIIGQFWDDRRLRTFTKAIMRIEPSCDQLLKPWTSKRKESLLETVSKGAETSFDLLKAEEDNFPLRWGE